MANDGQWLVLRLDPGHLQSPPSVLGMLCNGDGELTELRASGH